MSQTKLWTLRTILVAGAATFALGVSAGPSFAAGHEGSMAGMKGGGGGGREMRSTNEHFDSMRVESLSPAGFINPSSAPGVAAAPRPEVAAAPRPEVAAAPRPGVAAAPRPEVTAAPRPPRVRSVPLRRSPEPRVQPPAQS